MIKTIINRLGVIVFCLGICSADSENLIFPIGITLLGIILISITKEETN